MTKRCNINFLYTTGENWYCFAAVPENLVDSFDAWMDGNLPDCQTGSFGHGPGRNYEIHGNTAAERMLFTMRWVE